MKLQAEFEVSVNDRSDFISTDVMHSGYLACI